MFAIAFHLQTRTNSHLQENVTTSTKSAHSQQSCAWVKVQVQHLVQLGQISMAYLVKRWWAGTTRSVKKLTGFDRKLAIRGSEEERYFFFWFCTKFWVFQTKFEFETICCAEFAMFFDSFESHKMILLKWEKRSHNQNLRADIDASHPRAFFGFVKNREFENLERDHRNE
jgi:hypothetical protein